MNMDNLTAGFMAGLNKQLAWLATHPAQVRQAARSLSAPGEAMRTPQWYLDLLFHKQVEQDSARTIVCAPGMEHAIRAAIDQLGVRHDLHKVVASSFCPDGTAYVIDEQAINAAMEEQVALMKPSRPWEPRIDADAEYHANSIFRGLPEGGS